ncbi:MAG: carboxypeptidase-like regulatory domain-containing protein [Paludibacter sp.]|nr:carboxypeptidase-like regulatory domain-containing protein [Paludibacter sp.]
MRKLSLILVVSLLTSFSLLAQTIAKGVIKAADSGAPLSGVIITFLQQNISTQTNAKGEFTLSYLKAGDEELSISRQGYFTQIKLVKLKENQINDLGAFDLKADIQDEVKQEIVLQLSETELNSDEAKSTQNVSGALSSKGDIYASQTNFAFSPMRFRTRGYDQDFESTYINGIYFNGLERDNFNFSSLGGLNDAFRNQEEINGIAPTSFSYGNLGSATNINTKASVYAAGSKASFAYTNRAYKLRGQYMYATGLMQNGWAFAASAVVRWADKGIVQGTFYQSAGYFLSAEKVFNSQHSLSLVTFGAPTQRAQQGAVTQEVYDLAGSIYYNPYWGYQEGKVRNSRIVKSFDPTAILTHDFKIDENQRLRSGLAYHYSMYSNSALNFYGAPDRRSDYYRYLPSSPTDDESIDEMTTFWKTDSDVSQINWNDLYLANYRNNAIDPTGVARYSIERRHSNLMETALNSTYTNQLSKELKLTAGVEGKISKAMHYKTMDDLLGGNQWIDIDQFAERDFPTNPNVIQNDLNNPNAVVKVGDIFGYNYDINILHGAAFAQNEWILPQLDIFYAGQVTYTQFSRYGHMKNGRAEALNVNSYGQGKTWFTADPSLKAGATYKIDGRNRLSVNVQAEKRAPGVDNAYISQRIKDTAVPMESEKVLSYDVNYNFTFSSVRGRISGFRTHSLDGIELNGYYDDINQTFVNHVLTKVKKLYQGIEAGISFKLNSSFTFSLAGTVADYHYTDNAQGILSFENGVKEDKSEQVMIKNIKLSTGPQTAGSAKLSYFNSKMWFVDLTLNYFDRNYLDVSPLRLTKSNMALYTTDEIMNALGTQEKLKGGYLLDASVGKVIYLKNRHSLNINLSASNILNNTHMISGGYSQSRLPLNGAIIDINTLNKFPSKYYYAWGFNMFLNIGYKF